MTRPALKANRDTLSFVLFLAAAIIFILGAFGVSPLGTSPNEWQDVGLAAFVLGALV
jgi:hypothetical protein